MPSSPAVSWTASKTNVQKGKENVLLCYRIYKGLLELGWHKAHQIVENILFHLVAGSDCKQSILIFFLKFFFLSFISTLLVFWSSPVFHKRECWIAELLIDVNCDVNSWRMYSFLYRILAFFILKFQRLGQLLTVEQILHVFHEGLHLPSNHFITTLSAKKLAVPRTFQQPYLRAMSSGLPCGRHFLGWRKLRRPWPHRPQRL